MVITKTACSNCIHEKICSIKEDVKTVKDKIMSEYGNVDSSIEISVKCKEHCLTYRNR